MRNRHYRQAKRLSMRMVYAILVFGFVFSFAALIASCQPSILEQEIISTDSMLAASSTTVWIETPSPQLPPHAGGKSIDTSNIASVWLRAFDLSRNQVNLGTLDAPRYLVELIWNDSIAKYTARIDVSRIFDQTTFIAYALDASGAHLYGGSESVVLLGANLPTPISIPASSSYALGDTGPSGGIVFYASATYNAAPAEGGYRYMEAFPKDEAALAFGPSPSSTSALRQTMGLGLSNTLAVASAQRTAELREGSTPALLCDTFAWNGYDDWFLPSVEEIKAQAKTPGITLSGSQWSSSFFGSFPYSVNPETGVPSYSVPATTALAFRPARRF